MTNYVETANNFPWLWGSEQMVSPGGGNYSQTRPTVETSRDNSVSTFWYDDRAGSLNTGLMGSRFNDISGNNPIGWFKSNPATRRRTIPRSTPLDVQLYPDPVSHGSGGNAIMSFQAPESGYMEIIVTDILGRTIVVPYQGDIDQGSHRIDITIPTNCPSGTYFISLKMNRSIFVHTLRVVW